MKLNFSMWLDILSKLYLKNEWSSEVGFLHVFREVTNLFNHFKWVWSCRDLSKQF